MNINSDMCGACSSPVLCLLLGLILLLLLLGLLLLASSWLVSSTTIALSTRVRPSEDVETAGGAGLLALEPIAKTSGVEDVATR